MRTHANQSHKSETSLFRKADVTVPCTQCWLRSASAASNDHHRPFTCA